MQKGHPPKRMPEKHITPIAATQSTPVPLKVHEAGVCVFTKVKTAHLQRNMLLDCVANKVYHSSSVISRIDLVVPQDSMDNNPAVKHNNMLQEKF
jgi:hypothetical protein